MFRIGILLFVATLIGAKNIDTDLYEYELNEQRIVGGHDAEIHDFPHQISLISGGIVGGGGSIYKSNIIITAAHCIGNKDPSYYAVNAGSSLSNVTGQEVTVKKIIMHEKYNKNAAFDYDIAILVLDGHLEFNERVQPITLRTSHPPTGSEVTATGWGVTETGKESIQLQQVQVETVDRNQCSKMYSKVNRKITSSMLCAGVENGGKDACQNDSGGPLIYGQELLGVTSWGRGCGLKDLPGVYASIPDLYDWIIETVKENEN